MFNVQSINATVISDELSKQALQGTDLKKINNVFFLYYFYSRRGLPWQWPTQSNLVVATILVTYLDKLLIFYVCNKTAIFLHREAYHFDQLLNFISFLLFDRKTVVID